MVVRVGDDHVVLRVHRHTARLGELALHHAEFAELAVVDHLLAFHLRLDRQQLLLCGQLTDHAAAHRHLALLMCVHQVGERRAVGEVARDRGELAGREVEQRWIRDRGAVREQTAIRRSARTATHAPLLVQIGDVLLQQVVAQAARVRVRRVARVQVVHGGRETVDRRRTVQTATVRCETVQQRSACGRRTARGVVAGIVVTTIARVTIFV